MNQYSRTILGALLLATVLCLAACSASLGNHLEGKYSDTSGAFKLELRSAGKATLTTLNDTTACTYKVDGKQLTVQCENQTLPFAVQDDGSLMPPPEAQLGPLKKAKS
jgi:hypothetical protein